MKRGQILAMVGPSGAGKDSLLRWLADRLGRDESIRIAQRWITRAAHPSEDHRALDDAQYDAMLAADEFALHWRGNGTRYAVGHEIDRWCDQGATVLYNGSRAHLPQLLRCYPQAGVIQVRVSPAVMAQRLRERARETEREIAERLERHAALDAPLPLHASRVFVLDNDGPLESSGNALLAYLRAITRFAGRDRRPVAPDRPQTLSR